MSTRVWLNNTRVVFNMDAQLKKNSVQARIGARNEPEIAGNNVKVTAPVAGGMGRCVGVGATGE